MKKYLWLLCGLAIFAVGFGIGREQGKESVLRNIRELRDQDFREGVRGGYIGGATDQFQCDDYTQRSFFACERVQKRLDEFDAETKKAEMR